MKKTKVKGDKNFVFSNVQAGGDINVNMNIGGSSSELPDSLIPDSNLWWKSLAQELQQQGVSVGEDPTAVYRHYGWLIETFLLKISAEFKDEKSNPDKDKKKHQLRRLFYIMEAFQNSLRYLCYIQVAQVFRPDNLFPCSKVTELLRLSKNDYHQFDFPELLYQATSILDETHAFVPEITELTQNIKANDDKLEDTIRFMCTSRKILIDTKLKDVKNLESLLERTLNELTHWLCRLAFLAKYRLISVKEISVENRLRTKQKIQFIHQYGELHGVYSAEKSSMDHYTTRTINDVFTYNQSVLLLKAPNVDTGLSKISDPQNYLSLSPLVIDKNVFATKVTTTPSVYYYTGRSENQYIFANYRDELNLEELGLKANPLTIKRQNKDTELNKLHEQIKDIFGQYTT